MGQNILIAGITGYIGSALNEYLQRTDPDATIYGLARTELVRPNYYPCDLNDRLKLRALLLDLKPDVIYDCAGGRMISEEEMYVNNFLASKNLFEIVKSIENYNPRIIVPGTAAEIGIVEDDVEFVDESYLCKPVAYYGFVKLLQTNLCLYYARTGLDIILARVFNICGKATPASLAIGRFAEQIVNIEEGEQEPEFVTGGLASKRDYLDVMDVCSAFVAVAQKGVAGELYNVCSGEPFIIRDMLNELVQLSESNNIVVTEEDRQASHSFDVVGSNQKIKWVTGWTPTVSITQSLKETLEFYRLRFNSIKA